MALKVSKTYAENEKIRIFNNYLFIDGFASKYIKIKNKILEIAKRSTYENYKLLAQQWIEDNRSTNLNNQQKEILLNIFNDSNLGVIYGPAGTGKTLLLKFISEITKSRKKLFLAQTNVCVNNLKQKIGKYSSNDRFLTISSFKKQLADPDNSTKYNVIIIDECSVISNDDINDILQKAKYEQLIFVGDNQQIESIRLGTWFKSI
ncbi:AAA family ATPase [Mesomycoplasma hyorhinis]|uniref:AAA family ATPase n=1 Tax=Mesomycoplasma hyorhinis TaxID=2100 RepID=UPI002805ED6A|nr:AAA family ATPase [Mesomycoplasma hyorhinis]